jgi:hypothetical protein
MLTDHAIPIGHELSPLSRLTINHRLPVSKPPLHTRTL